MFIYLLTFVVNDMDDWDGLENLLFIVYFLPFSVTVCKKIVLVCCAVCLCKHISWTFPMLKIEFIEILLTEAW
jgi:hypothetical protein